MHRGKRTESPFLKRSRSSRRARPAGCGAAGIEPRCCSGPSARPALSHCAAHMQPDELQG